MPKRLPYTTIASDPPPSNCAKCGSARVVPIEYGRVNPTKKVREALDRGEYVLGGDVFGPDSATWRCLQCGTEGGRMRIIEDTRAPSDRAR